MPLKMTPMLVDKHDVYFHPMNNMPPTMECEYGETEPEMKYEMSEKD